MKLNLFQPIESVELNDSERYSRSVNEAIRSFSFCGAG